MWTHKSENDTVLLDSLQWLPVSLRLKAELFTTACKIATQREPQHWHPLVSVRNAGLQDPIPFCESETALSQAPSWCACPWFGSPDLLHPRGPVLTLQGSPPTSPPSTHTHSSPVSGFLATCQTYKKHFQLAASSDWNVLPARISPDLLPHLFQFFTRKSSSKWGLPRHPI